MTADWMVPPGPDPARFPYDAVLVEFHRAGKHFVPRQVLAALDKVRNGLPAFPVPASREPARRLLAEFLTAALDKFDGRYDYQTYLGLRLLPLPGRTPGLAQARRDHRRLIVLLLTDLLAFELDAAAGAAELLPVLRPDPAVTAKRCRHILHVTDPVAAAPPPVARGGQDLTDRARRYIADARGPMTDHEVLLMRLSLLPVYVVHDEYLFIRVLQAFETTFALLAIELRAAVVALHRGDGPRAVGRVDAAAAALRQAAPLFPLLATMQVDAFRIFRAYTEGASAIQSRTYKWVEALCETPQPDRLDSVAFRAVPEVREQALAGPPTLGGALRAAVEHGRLTGDQVARVQDAMHRFAAVLTRWRRTHHGLAVRMLGERSGTGYTEGTPYLKAACEIPVFRGFDRRPAGRGEAPSTDHNPAARDEH